MLPLRKDMFEAHDAPLRSSVEGVAWPALPDAPGATMLAMQFQLEQTQWWPAAELERSQLRQLGNLLRHAYDTVPFWCARLRAAGYDPQQQLTREWFATLPLLTRDDVQREGEALLCRNVPPQHGRVVQGETSGSTGKPITFYGTELTQFFWRAFTLRDHLWHRRDFSGKLAGIRTKVEDREHATWGPAVDVAFASGLSVTLNIRADVDAQLAWLQRQDPNYLITHPSNLRALARRALARAVKLPRLRQARTFGETLGADVRALCRQAWGVAIVDIYSAEEVGYMALQCPEYEHYHVQAEGVLLEVLDARGAPCALGAVGRMVVTPLHNFAMPLIRYEIGDYAEVGAPCVCGRGLPVLARVMGRARNMVRLPDGREHWPSFPAELWTEIAPVEQFRLVQREPCVIEAQFVAARSLSAAEEAKLMAALRASLGYPFDIRLARVATIERGSNLKFEDFVSELAG